LEVDEILTPSEVADLLKINTGTVYMLVRKGLIPGTKIGGSWRFSKNRIMTLVARGEGRTARDRVGRERAVKRKE
jgi:excisionase family DNA binding protein